MKHKNYERLIQRYGERRRGLLQDYLQLFRRDNAPLPNIQLTITEEEQDRADAQAEQQQGEIQ